MTTCALLTSNPLLFLRLRDMTVVPMTTWRCVMGTLKTALSWAASVATTSRTTSKPAPTTYGWNLFQMALSTRLVLLPTSSKVMGVKGCKVLGENVPATFLSIIVFYVFQQAKFISDIFVPLERLGCLQPSLPFASVVLEGHRAGGPANRVPTYLCVFRDGWVLQAGQRSLWATLCQHTRQLQVCLRPRLWAGCRQAQLWGWVQGEKLSALTVKFTY